MLVLGILAGAALLLIAYSVWLSSRLSFPDRYESRPAPLEGLPPDEAARVEAWSRALEAKGFRRVDDFRVDLPLGRGIVQVEQKRVWLSEDRTTWASAKRVSVLNPSMDGVVRAFRILAFMSRRPSGGVIATHTCPAAENSFLRDPESSTRVWPGMEDVDLLHEAHARHLRETGVAPEVLDGDLAAFERAAWERVKGIATSQGYLREREGRFHSTPKLAFVSALRGLNPRLQDRAAAAKLAALAAAGILGAYALSGPWALAGLFAASAAAACALFPHSHLVSWVLASLPAHALLTARGEPAGWGWIAGTLTIVMVVPTLESWRYQRAAAALKRPDAGPPPLTKGERRAWAAGVAGSLLVSAGALAWMRSPKDLHPLPHLIAALGALACAGLLLASIIAGLAARRTSLKRTLDGLSICALILLGGTVGGFGLAREDEKASEAAADQVVERLEAHRTARGSYPATLAELGPLPAPRCGWGPAAFTYIALPEGYSLIWPSARGPRSRP
jgi:hypothetical protein